MNAFDQLIHEAGERYLAYYEQILGLKPMSTGTTAPREGDTIRVTMTLEGKYADDGCVLVAGSYGIEHRPIESGAKVDVIKRRTPKVQDLLTGDDVYYNAIAGAIRPGAVLRNQRTQRSLVFRNDWNFASQNGKTFHITSFLAAGTGTQYKVIYLGEG